MGLAELLAALSAVLAPAAPPALAAGGAPSPAPPAPVAAQAAAPNLKPGIFAPVAVSFSPGKLMSVRFQVRNLEKTAVHGVSASLALPDYEDIVSLDCGPGAVNADQDGCDFASIPPRTLYKMSAVVRLCCVDGSTKVITNTLFVSPAAAGVDSFDTRLR